MICFLKGHLVEGNVTGFWLRYSKITVWSVTLYTEVQWKAELDEELADTSLVISRFFVR